MRQATDSRQTAPPSPATPRRRRRQRRRRPRLATRGAALLVRPPVLQPQGMRVAVIEQRRRRIGRARWQVTRAVLGGDERRRVRLAGLRGRCAAVALGALGLALALALHVQPEQHRPRQRALAHVLLTNTTPLVACSSLLLRTLSRSSSSPAPLVPFIVASF